MSIYQSLYDLVHQYIFGGVGLTANMDLIATALSSVGVVFLVSLPFLIVYRIVLSITG